MVEEEIDLKELFLLFWKKKKFIIIVTTICIVVGMIFSFFVKNQSYTAYSYLIFGRIEGYEPREGESQLLSEIQFNSTILGNYKSYMKSNEILNTVINNLNLEDTTLGNLKKNIEITTSSGTIEISVTSDNKEEAKNIANEIINVFVQKSRDFYRIEHTYTISEADESTMEVNTSYVMDLICYIFAGLVVGFGIIVIRYIFNPSIISEKDIETKLKLPFISSIILKKEKKGNIIESLDASEQFDVLRANIEFSTKNNLNKKTVFVTSINKGEGKTFVASNLALAFSKVGKNVLIIDTDKKDGILHKLFEVENNYGLSNYLVDSNKISEKEKKTENNLIQQTKYDNLDVITIGNVKGKKLKIIQNEKFIKFLDEMKEVYDIIILDGSEMLQYADSRFLSNICDNTLVIAGKNKTKEKDLINATKEIEKIKGNLLGIILNEIEN